MARHLISISDLTREEILFIIELSLEYKRLRARGVRLTGELQGRSVAMLFEKPSTRTRASFAVAVYEMGGLPVVYTREELQLARGEPVKDTARVLSRYHDAIAARVYKHEVLEEFTRYSSVSVINLLSDKEHPLQAIADYVTIYEKFGRVDDVRIAFIGDGRDNVFTSLAVAGLKLGSEIRVASPPQYQPDVSALIRAAKEVRGSIEVYEDPFEAVKGAHVVYTDVFVSMGQEAEREDRLKAFLPGYRVTSELMKSARSDAVFMHCLPARRGEEVEDEVIEGPYSIVFDQAENRLHSAKAVLRFLLTENLKA
ncbi:MAG: ornithine carbamoyltransferase [Thermofilaceae archaeon]